MAWKVGNQLALIGAHLLEVRPLRLNLFLFMVTFEAYTSRSLKSVLTLTHFSPIIDIIM